MQTSLLRVGLILPLLFANAGCKSSPTATAPTTPADHSAPGDAGSGSATGNSNNTTDARALVDAWADAQNAATFPKYEALYASRFEGIRRSGERVVKLDRARWMRERERMFQQRTVVTLKDIVITPSHDGAEVRFVQTWVSDAYRDEGTKRMVLVREGNAPGGSLKIAREEMLSSKVAPPGTTLPGDKFAFVIAGVVPQLVIATQAKNEWATGTPKLTSMESPVTTRREASGLPSELDAWKSKRVELFGKTGSVCEGTIGALAIVGRVAPHFGTVAHWRGADGEPKPTADAVAQEAWDLSDNADSDNGGTGRVVVGDIKVDKGDCKGALWGRAIADSKPIMVAGTVADAALTKQARAELRKTSQYAEIQKSYVAEKDPKDPPQWEDFDPTVETTVFTQGASSIVTIAIRAGSGCGSFGATLSAVFEKKEGKLTLLHEPFQNVIAPIAPLSVGDVDGDGRLDVIGQDLFMRSRGAKLDDPIRLSVPDLDCGC